MLYTLVCMVSWTAFRRHIGYLPSREQERVHDAFVMGERAHGSQQRKSGEPYFTHPIAVAEMLADIRADPDTLIAALLHDTLEDTGLSLDDIQKSFGDAVANIVQGVTKLCKEDIDQRATLDDQVETIRKMFTLMQGDVRIMIIKLYDRLHNMQTIEALKPERQRSLAQETYDVYVRIADRLCMQDLHDELEEWCVRTLHADRFPSMVELRTGVEESANSLTETLRAGVVDLLPDASLIDIHHEHRAWSTQMKQHLDTNGKVQAPLSMVFVCRDRNACYTVLGALHSTWKREVLSFQDFINAPKINGYQGIHTTIILGDGTRVRCKMRTPEMQSYARLGVSLKAFDGKEAGVFNYLPWTQHVLSLAQDTKDRSMEFWDSLQSDILGSTFILHGPGDETVHLPSGATALDGALYLFGDLALRLTSLKVNDVDAQFTTPLHHADVLQATFGDELTVERSWLECAKTAVATAMIRAALAKLVPEEEKILIGKTLFGRIMQQEHRGFIEEFAEGAIQKGLQALGLSSLEEAFIAIANGHVEPRELHDAIFTPFHQKHSAVAVQSVRFSCDMQDFSSVSRILDVCRSYGTSVQRGSLRLRWRWLSRKSIANVVMRLRITGAEQEAFASGLRNAGAMQVKVGNSALEASSLIALIILIVIWGLDPVFAKALLADRISPALLTFVRFATLWAAGLLAYAVQYGITRESLKPLNPFQPTLALSAIALFFTALSTYFTLTALPATTYILFIIGGIAASSFIRDVWHGHLRWHSIISLLCLLLGVWQLRALNTGTWTTYGLATLSAVGFAGYSIISARYQRDVGMIRTRYPAFLFWMGTMCLFCSLGILLATRDIQWDTGALATAAGFSLMFTVLPYVIYFEYSRRLEPSILDRALPFVCLATVIGESIYTGTTNVLWALPSMLVFLALQLWQKRDDLTHQ